MLSLNKPCLSASIIVAALVTVITFFAGNSLAFEVKDNMYEGCDKHSPNWLGYGFGMNPGSCLVSPNGKYIAKLQSDGGFAIHHADEVKPDNSGKTITYSDSGDISVIWSSGSGGKQGKELRRKDDGNLITYKSATRPIWTSNTLTHENRVLMLLDTGELIICQLNPSAGNWYGPEIPGWEKYRKWMTGNCDVNNSKVFGRH